jgi:hypothetical protein
VLNRREFHPPALAVTRRVTNVEIRRGWYAAARLAPPSGRALAEIRSWRRRPSNADFVPAYVSRARRTRGIAVGSAARSASSVAQGYPRASRTVGKSVVATLALPTVLDAREATGRLTLERSRCHPNVLPRHVWVAPVELEVSYPNTRQRAPAHALASFGRPAGRWQGPTRPDVASQGRRANPLDRAEVMDQVGRRNSELRVLPLPRIHHSAVSPWR